MITPPGLPIGCPPWFEHPAARAWTCAPALAEVQAFHAGLPGYAPTPLTEVPALAAELGVGRVFVKDESARMGLPAFKVLGASWAVHQVLSRRPSGDALTLVTATDGNHGRAVARMARLFGQRAHVFVPGGVHPTGEWPPTGTESCPRPGTDGLRRRRHRPWSYAAGGAAYDFSTVWRNIPASGAVFFMKCAWKCARLPGRRGTRFL